MSKPLAVTSWPTLHVCCNTMASLVGVTFGHSVTGADKVRVAIK